MEKIKKLQKETRLGRNGKLLENRDMSFEHPPPASFLKFLYDNMDKKIAELTPENEPENEPNLKPTKL